MFSRLQVPLLFAAVMLVGANAFVLTPILTEVAQGLGTQPHRVAWAISAFGAATAVSALVLAPLIDRSSAGGALCAAAGLLALGQAAGALSQGWLLLCLSQALAGVAVGVLLPGTYATAIATAPEGRESARLGAVLTGWALSLVMAVPAAALIAERFGWRMVYAAMAALSAATALGLLAVLGRVRIGANVHSSAMQALRLPGVALMLGVIFGYMAAFYGSFAYFGEGIRAAFGLTAEGTGMFVLAYGLGFGAAGIALSLAAPAITRNRLLAALLVIAGVYLLWGFALLRPWTAFGLAMAWGFANQLALNAMIVMLNRRAGPARSAVLGLNSAVTYSAVFAGPMVMGPLFLTYGYGGVTVLGAALVLAGALLIWRDQI